MPNTNTPDESWDELARELGLERSSSPADEAGLSPVTAGELSPQDDPEEAPIEEERPARGHPRGAAEDFEGHEEFEPAGEDAELDEEIPEGEATEEGQSDEGQPGTGRKRRRRRRRRKKGGAAAPAVAEAEVVESAEAAESGETGESGHDFTVTARVEDDHLVDSEEFEDEEVAVEVGAEEEDVGGEVLRELTVNWNVPSWDEIVGGLYRPER